MGPEITVLRMQAASWISDLGVIVCVTVAPKLNERIVIGRSSEAPVEQAFKRWLESQGWRLIDEAGSWADLIAEGTNGSLAR